MLRFVARRPALVYAALVLCGCGTPATPAGAQRLIDTYREAIARDNPDGVHALLEPRLRRRIDNVALRHSWRRLIAELRSQSAGLSTVDGDSLRVTARVRTSGGSTARLELEDGQWRIAQGLAEVSRYSTPREALRALLTALRTRNYHAALEVLSPRLRRAIEHEMRARTERVNHALEQPVDIRGPRAVIELPGGQALELQRAGKTWVVTQIE
jgi:hypothetical protein